MAMNWRYLSKEDGLTLVEVLGSIVILSIIVMTFLALFIQSAQTTKVSGEISAGLYLAQQQVEEIYNLSKEQDYDSIIANLIRDSDHHQSIDGEETFIFTKEDYQMTIEILPAKNDADQIIENLYTLIVKSYDHTGKQQAQLETKFFFPKAGIGNE